MITKNVKLPCVKCNKYEARTQKKKEAILEAALFYFRSEGFSKASIKDIAGKAQVSQVSIYNYYGSKDGLALECAQKLIQGTMEEAITVLHKNKPYLDKLNQALSLCNGGTNQVLADFLSEKALQDSSMMKLFTQGVRKRQRDVYEQYIEEGKKEGYIDNAIATETILKYIMALSTIELDSADYESQLQDFHKLVLHGFLIK